MSYQSTETVDQVAEALDRIQDEVEIIERHYHNDTDWPGWDGDAVVAVKLGHRLTSCALNSRVVFNVG